MIAVTVTLLSALCSLVQSSEFHPIAPAGTAPVVTAASSQYFERTFNRLVAAPALQPVFPVAPPAPPVVVDAKTTITPVIPTNPPQPLPADPNVAIAIATAHAAAPVATILLPPYPFGIPPHLGFIPSAPPFNVPSENPNRESTTPRTTTTAQATTTTEKDLEVAPLPSNNDNSIAQPFPLPSDENVNFRQYLEPQPARPVQQLPRPVPQPTRPVQQQPRPLQPAPVPQWPQPPLPQQPRPLQPAPVPQWPQPPLPQQPRPMQQTPLPQWPQPPQKLKTTVEVVPVPLTYIAPPPLNTHAHLHFYTHGHHDHHIHDLHVYDHAYIKIPKHGHIHTHIPKKVKIIIRPARIHTVRVPARLVIHKAMSRSSPRFPQSALRASDPREREPTTFRPLNRPMTKPPRL